MIYLIIFNASFVMCVTVTLLLQTIANKPYGRRLIYDQSHPQKMYASQWSSELADPPGPYSFPTTTGLPAEQPWNKVNLLGLVMSSLIFDMQAWG